MSIYGNTSPICKMEQRWDTAFNRTQSALVAAGQTTTMDYNQL